MPRKLVDSLQRRRAAALAGHAGDEPAARHYLRDDDPAVRATALGALDRMDALGTDDLVAALADEATTVRRRAAELCAGIAGDAPPSLLPVLEDSEASVAEMAAWASGERVPPEPGAVAALSTVVLDHSDPLCREAAVAALGALGDPAGLPAILAATKDKPAIRRRAVLALAPFAGPDVEAALAAALTDRDWQVRQAAEDLSAP